MTRHYNIDDEGSPYGCHFCNCPVTEDEVEFITEYNGRELYFCSKVCMYEWETVDNDVFDAEDEQYDG